MSHVFHSEIFDRNMLKVSIKENQKRKIILESEFLFSYSFTDSSLAPKFKYMSNDLSCIHNIVLLMCTLQYFVSIVCETNLIFSSHITNEIY